jgi:hypothetical protein
LILALIFWYYPPHNLFREILGAYGSKERMMRLLQTVACTKDGHAGRKFLRFKDTGEREFRSYANGLITVTLGLFRPLFTCSCGEEERRSDGLVWSVTERVIPTFFGAKLWRMYPGMKFRRFLKRWFF